MRSYLKSRDEPACRSGSLSFQSSARLIPRISSFVCTTVALALGAFVAGSRHRGSEKMRTGIRGSSPGSSFCYGKTEVITKRSLFLASDGSRLLPRRLIWRSRSAITESHDNKS
jgi:hypothetical protein